MKFKHSEPLEVPPWKKRRRRGGRLRKTGKICGFDARISPWGTAGWLVPPNSGIRSSFRMIATLPKTPFPAIPYQQAGTNWEGAEEEPKRRNLREGEKWMEAGKVGSKQWGTMGGDKKVLLSVPCTHPSITHLQAHTHTHTHMDKRAPTTWDWRETQFTSYGHTPGCTRTSGIGGSHFELACH